MAAMSLGVALTTVFSLGTPLQAQGQGRSREQLVAKLKGKKVKIDASTAQLREMTTEEAESFIDTIARMTDRTALEARVAAAGASRRVSLEGHIGHVNVARPNPDGTTTVRCVASADEAVAFLAEEPPDVQ